MKFWLGALPLDALTGASSPPIYGAVASFAGAASPVAPLHVQHQCPKLASAAPAPVLNFRSPGGSCNGQPLHE